MFQAPRTSFLLLVDFIFFISALDVSGSEHQSSVPSTNILCIHERVSFAIIISLLCYLTCMVVVIVIVAL